MTTVTRLAAMFLVSAGLSAAPLPAEPAKVAGKWNAALQLDTIRSRPTLTFKQDGEKLSGVVKSQRGERPVEGTVKGKDVTIKWTTKYEDNDLPITLTGTLDGGTMKGSADYGGFAQGDFSAKRAVLLLRTVETLLIAQRLEL